MTDTTPTSNAGQHHRLAVVIDEVQFFRSAWGTWYGTDGSDVDESWILERAHLDHLTTPTSNAGHRDSARQREYARLPFHAHGSYAHDTVSAHGADHLWRTDGVDYVVSGDQSLRVHGTLGMRRAGRPGQWLTTQSRRRDARRMVAAGRLPHPLTVDELTRLGLTTQE